MPTKNKKKSKKRKTFGKKKSKSQLIQHYMKAVFTTPGKGASFSAPETMYREIERRGTHKISRNQIRKFLQSMDSYTLTRTIKPVKDTAKIVVPESEWQIEADTLDMISYDPSANDNIRYLVTALDAFNRKAVAVPIKGKQPGDMVEALETIFMHLGIPVTLRSDRGYEFKFPAVRDLLAAKGVHHFFANSQSHASIVERWHRTLRQMISRYLEYKNTDRFIDALPDLVTSYNATPHRTLGYLRPIDIQGVEREADVYERLYLEAETIKKIPYRFEIGDRVRLAKIRGPFEKEGGGRDFTFTRELFTVHKRMRKNNVNLYKVIDCSGEVLEGKLYENDMAKVVESPNTKYKIDKVLDEKVENGVKFLKVTLKGYPKVCTQWVRQKDVVNL